MRKLLLTLATMLVATAAMADIPEEYYVSLNGKKGAELKAAITTLISKHTTLTYGPGDKGTWWGFYITDQLPDGTYRNRYSPLVYKVGVRGSRPTASVDSAKNSNGNCIEMNIEHSFPKSWWGSSTGDEYNDLFNLYPSDASTNSGKSNYIMDEVSTTTSADDYAKIGSSTHVSGKKCWEPIDQYKGDFSRGYMYQITCYANKLTWTSEGLNCLDNNTYPTFKAWAATLYTSWNGLDPVDQVEIDRNDSIYTIQGNRNPFIDFPNLAQYIWGDSTEVEFNLQTISRSSNFVPGGAVNLDPDPVDESLIYDADYKQATQPMSIVYNQPLSGLTYIWQQTANYGWKASAYKSKCYASDATLLTEAIDLTGYTNARMVFHHAVNKDTSPSSRLSVEITCEGTTTTISPSLITCPAGNSWVFNSSDTISLSQFDGKKIQIGFRYTSTTSVAATWEIDWLKVKGDKTGAGISSLADDQQPAFNPEAPAEYFDITGRRVSSDNTHGIIIVRQAGRSYKLLRH